MLDRHFAFWPPRLPHALTLPETPLCYNLEVSATRYPDKTAVSYYGAAISFRRLLAEVEAMAGFLQRRLGVAKGDRVLLDMQNSPQFIVAYYAVLRTGAAVVPVNPMNLADELRYYARDSGARLAFAGQELYERVAPLLADGTLDHLVVAAYFDYADPAFDLPMPPVVAAPRQPLPDARAVAWAEALAAGLVPGPCPVGPDDMAVLPYTSGTTGRPKGCVHTHRTVHATLVGGAVWGRATAEGVALVTLPLFHATGMQGGMNGPIYLGARAVLMTRWDRDLAAALIERERCTGWTNISTMMVDFLANPDLDRYDLGSLVAIGGGGAALPAAVGQRLQDRLGLAYVEGYGLTETIAGTHVNPSDRPKLQCLGIPLFDVDARVVDPETLRELGPEEVGEIVICAPQVFKGYWRRPEETEQAFATIEGKRFLRTGDLGRYDDEGYFFFVDRIKRMINASGFKVWPAEVEAILYEHPAIQEACVVGVPDPRRGETVKAFVVLREAARGQVTAEQIVAWAREHMAAYKCPHVVEIVATLPRSATGKVLWRELQERERAGHT